MLRFRLPKAGKYALSIHTPAGRTVFRRNGRGEAGLQTLRLPAGLAGGAYAVRLEKELND
jgi:hypothetical protein